MLGLFERCKRVRLSTVLLSGNRIFPQQLLPLLQHRALPNPDIFLYIKSGIIKLLLMLDTNIHYSVLHSVVLADFPLFQEGGYCPALPVLGVVLYTPTRPNSLVLASLPSHVPCSGTIGVGRDRIGCCD